MASDMNSRVIVIVMIFASAIFIPSSTGIETQEEQYCDAIPNLQFNGSQANESVQFQTSLGPRTPSSHASSELRESIKENLTGWRIIETTHHSNGYVLTNLFATWNPGTGNTVVLAAHYDTRDRTDYPEENLTPILGANDGASGVAVLLELARHIPAMNLSHEVTLFFTDGEDQGPIPSYLGAKAWSENLTTEEANSIESFVLVDMVGDIDLQLNPRKWPESEVMWNRTNDMAAALGLDENRIGCDGSNGTGTYVDNSLLSVGDDHQYAIFSGIPSIDIIDIDYEHWHTQNDTADKVSAESLEIVGELVELGLLTGTWLDIREDVIIDNSTIDDENNSSEDPDVTSETGGQTTIGVFIMSSLLLVLGILLWTFIAEKRGEG